MDKDTAYVAMVHFLKNWYDITKSEDLGELLSLMEFLDDGKPADSAMLEYWEDAINKAKNDTNGHLKKISFYDKDDNSSKDLLT